MQPPDADDSDEDEEMCMTAVGRRPRNRRVCAAVDSFSHGCKRGPQSCAPNCLCVFNSIVLFLHLSLLCHTNLCTQGRMAIS